MNILATEFSLAHRAYEVYLAGCRGPHCKGCHNPESWDFSAGHPADLYLDAIRRTLETADALVSNIWVLGGEPLDQDLHELVGLLKHLRGFGKALWLFTGKSLEEVPQEVLQLVDYVKTGTYREDLLPGATIYGVSLASSNQGITKVQH